MWPIDCCKWCKVCISWCVIVLRAHTCVYCVKVCTTTGCLNIDFKRSQAHTIRCFIFRIKYNSMGHLQVPIVAQLTPLPGQTSFLSRVLMIYEDVKILLEQRALLTSADKRLSAFLGNGQTEPACLHPCSRVISSISKSKIIDTEVIRALELLLSAWTERNNPFYNVPQRLIHFQKYFYLAANETNINAMKMLFSHSWQRAQVCLPLHLVFQYYKFILAEINNRNIFFIEWAIIYFMPLIFCVEF
jgi:hypothetical protein